MRMFKLPRVEKLSTKDNGKVAINIKNPFHVERKNLWKVKVGGFLILLGTLSALVYVAFFSLYNWVKCHEVIRQNPVVLRTPIIIKEIKDKIISPVSKEMSVKEKKEAEKKLAEDKRNATLERVYQYTRFLESRFGFDKTFDSTHVYCQNVGKVNEIGYFPDNNKKFCFENEAEQELTFSRWINKQLKAGKTMAQAMCYYVSGTESDSCTRARELGL